MDKKIENLMANIAVRVRQQVVGKVTTRYNEVTDIMRISIATPIGGYEDICNVQFHDIKLQLDEGANADDFASDVIQVFSNNVWKTFFKV